MLFFSCGGDTNSAEESKEVIVTCDPDGGWLTEYFLQFYITEITDITIIGNGYINKAYISIEGEGVGMGTDKEQYTELSELYNDTYYNNYISDPYQNTAFSEALDYINISCAEDYNENYKAGELLNDIIEVQLYQYYDYIQSGYESSLTKKVLETLTNINTKDYLLVDNRTIYLSFTEKPDVEGTLTYNFEIKMGDKIFNSSIDLKYEVEEE